MEESLHSQPNAKVPDSHHRGNQDNTVKEEELSCSIESRNTPQKSKSQQKPPIGVARNTSEASQPSDDHDESVEFLEYATFPFAPRGRVNTPVSGGKPKPKPK